MVPSPQRAWASALLVLALVVSSAMPIAVNGVLRLVEASSKALFFYMEIREGDNLWKLRENSTTIENGICHSSMILDNLNASTTYFVNVRELTRVAENWNWNRRPGFSANGSHVTCPHDVPEVTHLVIYSMNSSSVGLSWIPPKLPCKTRLEYRISFHSPGEETFVIFPKGVFWSNRLNLTDSVDTDVKHCDAWPDRHCLLVSSDRFKLNHRYVVEVAVNRVVDNVHSKHVNTTLKFTSQQM
ncbi:Protein of unknown function, partial [Gryllus bimaculatus]